MNAQVNIKEMMEKFAETTRVSIKRIENTKDDGYVLWFAKSKLAVTDFTDTAGKNVRCCLVSDAVIFTQDELDSIEKYNAPMPSIANSNGEWATLISVKKAKKLQIEKLQQELANFEKYEGAGA